MEKYLYTSLVALASGFVSSYITIKLGLHKDLITTKRERIEKYAMSLISVDGMLEKYREKYLFGYDDVVIDENGLGTVEVLTKLYFAKVSDDFNSFNKAVGEFKKNLFSTKQQLLISQQASQYPSIKSVPTQTMIDDSVRLYSVVYGERNALLQALVKSYPLLEDESFITRYIRC
jgi:hypothetical protein